MTQFSCCTPLLMSYLKRDYHHTNFVYFRLTEAKLPRGKIRNVLTRRSKVRLRLTQTRNIAAEPFCVNVAHNVAWVSKQEGSKRRGTNYASPTYVAWVPRRRNNRKSFKVNVSSVFPKCFMIFYCPTRDALKTQNLRLESNVFFRV